MENRALLADAANVMKDALRVVLEYRPEDPIAFMAHYLNRTAVGASRAENAFRQLEVGSLTIQANTPTINVQSQEGTYIKQRCESDSLKHCLI